MTGERSGAVSGSNGGDELTEREREPLAFEKTAWRYAGAKETAIRDLFGLSARQYYQVVNTLIDRQEAYVHDPPLVKRARGAMTEVAYAATAAELERNLTALQVRLDLAEGQCQRNSDPLEQMESAAALMRSMWLRPPASTAG